jgi:hypothetical protein
MVNPTQVVSDLGKFGEPTWEALKATEKRRRAILQCRDLPFYQTILLWDGTCLRLLMSSYGFWLTLVVYVCARVFTTDDFYSVIESDQVDTEYIAIIGGFLSFFLLFFVSQAYSRFNSLYSLSMSMEGRIFDIATLSRAALPRERGLRLVRYMNAAHAAGYVGLSGTYSNDNFFSHINESWKLLTDQEYGRMNEIDLDLGGSCYRELLAWCMMEVQEAATEGLLDPYQASMMRDLILRFRGSMGALFDYDDQPVSFFYLHFIVLLSSLYLPLFAVTVGVSVGAADSWLADAVGFLFVFLQTVFVCGLSIFGTKVSDPYGGDLEDLSVMHYVNFTCRMSLRILASENPAPLDAMAEENLSRGRGEAIGKAWEDKLIEGPVEDDAREFEKWNIRLSGKERRRTSLCRAHI